MRIIVARGSATTSGIKTRRCDAHPVYLKPLRIIRYHPRLIFSSPWASSCVASPDSLRLLTRLLIGWDVGAVFYLAAAFPLAQDFDLKRIQLRARSI